MLLSLLATVQTSAVILKGTTPPIQLVRIAAHGSTKSFLIGKFEVTMRQFKGFVDESRYDGKDFPSSKTSEPFLANWKEGRYPIGQDKHPVCYLNWHHAKAFCAWLGKKSGRPVRLPTNAEWTLAAAGVQGRRYPWGDTWDSAKCNTVSAEDGYAESSPVGAFPSGATPEGVMDMAGNIWEWSFEGNLRGGPWCMGKDRMECADVVAEDQERADDKFGLRVCVPEG